MKTRNPVPLTSGSLMTFITPSPRRLPLFFLLLVLFLSACSQAPQSGECDAHVVWSQEQGGEEILLKLYPTNCDFVGAITPQATVTPGEATATALPTETTVPTATQAVPAPSLINGNFETKPPVGYVRPIYGLPEINVMQGWLPYFCDQPYTQQKCVIPKEWNPYTTYLGRPEFKPANPDQDCAGPNQYANRVKRGCNAQQLFGFYRVVNGGVYQTVTTLVPGQRYTWSAWMQLWSAENAKGGCTVRDLTNRCIDFNSDPYTSDIASHDDRNSINARVGVDLSCGTNAFSQSVQWSRDHSYADGFYDHWGQIEITFTAISNCATLFAGGYNKYGKAHGDIYIDDARLSVNN